MEAIAYVFSGMYGDVKDIGLATSLLIVVLGGGGRGPPRPGRACTANSSNGSCDRSFSM